MSNPLKGCIPYWPESPPVYGYRPSLPAGIVFCVIFLFPTVLHCYQLWPKRVWWLVLFAIGGLGEIIGWGARVWAYSCPYNADAFMMQLASLILAPNFFTAGCYVVLSKMIVSLGRQYSPISSRLYLYIFCACDLVSLVIQGAGGGLAALAYNSLPPGDTKKGTNIMVVGILFQLVSISGFLVCFSLVLFRARRVLPRVPAVRLVALATVLSLVAIYIRSIYRTIELLQGWTGYLITTERYFIALDGAMMVISIGIFNIWNPSRLPGPPEPLSSGSSGPVVDEKGVNRGSSQDLEGVLQERIEQKC